jgi:hypothetical protein
MDLFGIAAIISAATPLVLGVVVIITQGRRSATGGERAEKTGKDGDWILPRSARRQVSSGVYSREEFSAFSGGVKNGDFDVA